MQKKLMRSFTATYEKTTFRRRYLETFTSRLAFLAGLSDDFPRLRRGTGGREPGRKQGGKCTGGGSRGSGTRNYQGGGKRKK